VSAASETGSLLRRRIAQVSEFAPGSIGDMLHFELLDCDPEAGDYLLSCRTETWMRNPAGTLHGGLGATVLDQAMGLIPYCLKTEAGIAPTVQLSVNYHRPLNPGAEVVIKVHVISVSRSLITLSAEARSKENPEKLCLSGTGLYLWKPAQ